MGELYFTFTDDEGQERREILYFEEIEEPWWAREYRDYINCAIFTFPIIGIPCIIYIFYHLLGCVTEP